MSAHRLEETHNMLFKILIRSVVFLELWHLVVRGVCSHNHFGRYYGLQSMEAAESLSCLTRASLSKLVRRVTGSLAALARFFTAERLLALVGVTPCTASLENDSTTCAQARVGFALISTSSSRISLDVPDFLVNFSQCKPGHNLFMLVRECVHSPTQERYGTCVRSLSVPFSQNIWPFCVIRWRKGKVCVFIFLK